MRKWGICFFFVLGIQLVLNATGLIFSNHINNEHGLSQSSVNAILQDRYGFVWIATDDGLNRYDGHNFQIINIPELDTFGYQNNYINAIFLDANENLWVGTRAGIYCLQTAKHSLVPFRIFPNEKNPVGEQIMVRDIKQRKNGQVLVLTRNSVLRLSESGQFEKMAIDSICQNEINFRLYSLFEDQKSRLWIGSSSGLLYYDERSSSFVRFQNKEIGNLPVVDISEDSKGELIICTTNQVFKYSDLKNTFYEAAINPILKEARLSISFTDINGDVWIGTRNIGLFQFDGDLKRLKASFNNKDEIIKSNSITSVFQDLNGLLWVGTNDNGAFILNLDEQTIRKIETNKVISTGINFMVPVPGEQKRFWAATSGQGIATVDYSDIDNITTFLPNDPVLKKIETYTIVSMLYHDPYLYIGSQENGLLRIKTRGEKCLSLEQYWSLNEVKKHELGTVSNLVLGPDTNIYFSSDKLGICCFNQQEKNVKQVSSFFESDQLHAEQVLPGFQVSAILADPEEFLWIGTQSNGLFKLLFKDGKPHSFKLVDQTILAKSFINCLYKTNDDLWIGTQGAGLIGMNTATNKISRFDERNGLANKVIHAIAADRAGDIWVSTNKGLAKLMVNSGMFINFTGSFYLQGYEFNRNAAMVDREGTLFFAGDAGINFQKSDQSQSNQGAPLVQISELLINNQLILPDVNYNERIVIDRSIERVEKLELYHQDQVVSFAISPIHYSDPRNNIFYYQLEPFDKTWVKRDMSNRYVTYNNLKGGTYRFRFKAVSSDGVISPEKSILVRVNPPLWEETWFNVLVYSMAGLLAGLLFLFWYKYQKHREYQLEHEKNTMQSLIDNIPDTIYFKDLQSRFTRINIAQAKLMGLENKEMAIGRTDFEFFDHADEAFQVEQEIIRTGIPVINQLHKLVVDGKVKYLSDTKIALYDKDKKCIGTVGVSRDLTDLKLAEDAMLESQAKFRALFENAPLAIFRIDKNQRIVEYNHRFFGMFGFSKSDDLNNLHTSDLLVDPELGNLIFETVLETKEVNAEINLKRRDGKTFIANLTLAYLEEGFKEITIEGIIEDITQMAVARDEIIKAKDKAVEADRLKSLFLANMSHEIRTPMNAIIGFTNMLREESLTAEDRNYFIDVIQNNGNNLVSLIDSIVDFSKLEAEQMSVSMGEFNINPLIESVIDHAEKSIKSEGKEQISIIKGKMEINPIRIVSDRHRLNQVFLHLISNAVKFTDKGEIEIGYYLEDGSINMYVRDTGIGIDDSKYEYIFQRFNKIEDKNRLYGGTGLGLTISKGLVELMGGTIVVESKVGNGSTFIIKLPYQETNNLL